MFPRALSVPIKAFLPGSSRFRMVTEFRSIESPIYRPFVAVTKTSAGSLPRADPDSQLKTATALPTPSTQDESVIITATCAHRIKVLAEKRNDAGLDALYLRVYVDAGGCSGFQYKFELTEDEQESVDPEDDVVFEKEGARVVIDHTSLDLIRGSTIDFVQEMIKSSFAVTSNPQSESACGCGSSFAVKNFTANPALD